MDMGDSAGSRTPVLLTRPPLQRGNSLPNTFSPGAHQRGGSLSVADVDSLALRSTHRRGESSAAGVLLAPSPSAAGANRLRVRTDSDADGSARSPSLSPTATAAEAAANAAPLSLLPAQPPPTAAEPRPVRTFVWDFWRPQVNFQSAETNSRMVRVRGLLDLLLPHRCACRTGAHGDPRAGGGQRLPAPLC